MGATTCATSACVPSHGADVSRGGGEEQVDDVDALGLVLVPPGVLLVGAVLQVVVAVEVEHVHQLLCQGKGTSDTKKDSYNVQKGKQMAYKVAYS